MARKMCSICGEYKDTTDDHLPPKGIYHKPIDNDMNMHTVPACSFCNGGGSKEDEEFKLFMGLETGDFRDNKEKIIDSLAGTIRHNKRLASQIFSNHKKIYAEDRSTIAEKVVAIKFNSYAYNQVISRIVKGLYWRKTGTPLGKEPNVTVLPANSLNNSQYQDFKEIMDQLPPNKLNKNTFIYKYIINDDGTSMQFFKRHTVFAIAEAKKHNKSIETPLLKMLL
ncbi:MAG: hypothetical protein Q8N78_10350 [Sulfurimonas sp.]|nr:hypothetical protein [Sulfurimonas sp.]